MELTDSELDPAVDAELEEEFGDNEEEEFRKNGGQVYVNVNGVVSYPGDEPPEPECVIDPAQGYTIANPDTPPQSPLAFIAEMETDRERAILANTEAKKAHRRATNALVRAQAIAVTLGEVDKSMEAANLGKNEFNRKHALALLANEEQQALMDAEDALDDARDRLTICNNRAEHIRPSR